METTAPKSIATVAPNRKTLWRYLAAFATLCLLLWSIKAIQYARQPKYQGKTAAEWFVEARGWPDIGEDKQLMSEPPGIAFKNMGTNAIWFLWREHLRKDSAITKKAYHYWDIVTRTTNTTGITREFIRMAKSFQYLCLLESDCKILLPELLPRLAGDDLDAVYETTYILGCIREEQDLVVPALLQSMMKSNRNEGAREFHLYALQKYGQKAVSATELLKQRLADTTLSQKERMDLAWTILAINGPGPEATFLAEQMRPGIYEHDLLHRMGGLGPKALPAVPTLIQYARNATNINHARGVMDTVQKIDPQGVYQKP
jgi:hypothetical protein